MKGLAKISLAVLTYLIGSAAAYIPFVVSDASKKFHDDDADYLLILGGDIIGADTPSPQLFERMKYAAVFLNDHPDVTAVPCGGCFRKGQKKSEAAVIADYLIEKGVSPDRIIKEEKSTTTFENFSFGIPLIEEYAGKSRRELKIGLLSSSYHMHRAGFIAKMNGISKVRRISVKTPGKAFKRFIREYFVAYTLLKYVPEILKGRHKK